jgi:hypothetical protein
MQNSIVFCTENPSLKNDKTPIKRQRSKVKTECKAREKKNSTQTRATPEISRPT